MKQDIKEMSEIFKILSNDVRLCILTNLCLNGEKKVGELQLCTKSSQSFVSQQLSKLKSLGIIDSRKSGVEVFYFLNNKKISNVIKLLNIGNTNI
ncbi:MAG: metalloregulator ArsR/SmtB family transcription factor [Clostridia bacterium]